MTDFNDLPDNVKNAGAMRVTGIVASMLAVSIAASCTVAWWVGIVAFLALLAAYMLLASRKDIIEFRKTRKEE